MKAKLIVALVAIFLIFGISCSYGADIPVTFTFQTQGEADLASWTIVEYDDINNPSGTTFNGTLNGGQIDVSTDEVLVYPDGAETTKCYTAFLTDTSGNDSDECGPVCKRVDDIPPGSCIDFGVIDR